MPRRHLAVWVLVPLLVLLATCGKNEPPQGQDGGTDGGGGPGEDAGSDAGVDAGNPLIECDPASPSGCAIQESCLHYPAPSGELGTRCFEGACDLVAQDCGAGGDAGLKCTYVDDDAGTPVRECVETGLAQEGQPCTGTSSSNTCAAGLLCVPRPQEDGGTQPVCLQFCGSSADCPAGKACLLVVDLSPSDERPFVCDTPCDLFAQDCPGSQACYPTQVAPACYPVAGTTGVGQACDYSSQCVAGAVCINGACAQLCVHPSGACPTGTCTRILVEGQPDAGACL